MERHIYMLIPIASQYTSINGIIILKELILHKNHKIPRKQI